MNDIDEFQKSYEAHRASRKRLLSIYDELIESITTEAVKGDLATIRVLNTLLVNRAKLENLI